MAYIYYNPNPMQKRVEDCSVRAISKALDIPFDKAWDTAFALITTKAFQVKDMAHSDAVWGSVLRDHGFARKSIPNSCPDCYTAEDFARDHPKGTYVLGFGGHVCTVESGNVFDSWDSSGLSPQFFWYRPQKEE